MQSDGNLVLYADATPTWRTYTNNDANVFDVVMQTDGNLVVYNTGGVPLWFSGTAHYPGAFLVIQNDGHAVIYDTKNESLWQVGHVLAAGETVTSTLTISNFPSVASTTSLSTSTLTAPNSLSTRMPDSSGHTGGIIGGVLGGVVLILLSLCIYLFLSRKRTMGTLITNVPQEEMRSANVNRG
jgi:hypothetical protein